MSDTDAPCSAPRVTLVAVLPAVTFALTFLFSYGADAGRMSLVGALTAAVGSAAVVGLSTVRPAAALGLVVGVAVLLPVVRATFEALAVVVVLVVFRAAASTSVRPAVLAVTSLAALSVNDVWLRTSLDRSFLSPTVLDPALFTALSVGLGLQTRRVRVQNAELLALRDLDRQRAVSDERRRIARDLHDVAAHHLSALVVRNKLAQRVDTREALQEAADFTSRTAADTLASLRQVVSVLSTEAAAPLVPQPGLAEIDQVVVRMEAAGLKVERSGTPVPSRWSDLDIAVVRIVQEALANVLRHRGPGRAWLDLRLVDDAVTLTVDDDGPSAGPGAAAATSGSRYGLAGMRERAEACGGALTVEASPRGGWRIRAELPVRSKPVEP